MYNNGKKTRTSATSISIDKIIVEYIGTKYRGLNYYSNHKD